MAIVISVSRLVKGIVQIGEVEPIQVRLRDTQTMFRDRASGWCIKGDEVKELPLPTADAFSQQLVESIRAGRFVRVKYASKKSKKPKYVDLIESIIEDADTLESLLEDEQGEEEQDE